MSNYIHLTIFCFSYLKLRGNEVRVTQNRIYCIENISMINDRGTTSNLIISLCVYVCVCVGGIRQTHLKI